MTRNGKQNGHRGDGHKTETPDVSHIRNVEVTHEKSDVSVRGVMMFVIILSISIAIVSTGVWVMFRYFNSEEEKAPQPGPMALQQGERLPPEPRLQAAPGFAATLENGNRVNLQADTQVAGAPQAEYRVLREQWNNELRGQLKDRSGSPTSIPIDQAMKQVVANGLPTRAQKAPGKLEDYGISMPTYWSSGRETVKRVQ